MRLIRQPDKRDDRGAVAILVAVSLTMLLVVAAMVLDFGLVRLDRQRVKLVADAAVMSGLRAAANDADQAYTFRGVCSALEFLKANEPSLSGLPAGICDGSQDTNAICDPANAANAAFPANAFYTGTVSSGGVTTEVTIKMPYLVSVGGFPEENYASLTGDTSANSGCDQLGIIIRQSRRPGLGSLATSSDLVLRQRSVARVQAGDGDLPPALLLLERRECDVLTVGSSGSPSRIQVFGSSAPLDVPSTIHSDSDASASDCGPGPNEQIFQGKQADGVVAYGTNSGSSGVITSVAAFHGVDAAVVSDAGANVYGTPAIGPGPPAPTTKTAVQGRSEVGRAPVDERYLNGVTQRVIAAHDQWTLDHSAPAGYTRYGCSPNMSVLGALDATAEVYIDCPGSSGITLTGTIGAGTIYFHGFIKGGKLIMPNAEKVYIDNTDNSGSRISSDALTLNTGDGFCVRSTSCEDIAVGQCDPEPTESVSQAFLMVRAGALSNSNEGLLRLCNTSVTLGSGDLGSGGTADPGACLPTSIGSYLPDPDGTTPPCPGGAEMTGDGFIDLSGWTDWTAPNQYGDMDAEPLSDTQKQAAWDAGEDLALWVETYGDDSDFKMAGGADLNVAGVFMAPNATPFTFSGNATFDLQNAQFITRKFAADGGALLLMRVDPYNAVTITQPVYTLVR